ncbi:MAG: carbamate kinase [Planctomycetota bacterium]
MAHDKTAVVAFGGNALITEDEPGYEEVQIELAEKLAEGLLPFLRGGYDLLLVHGNGPQVGNSIIRVEESITKVPELTLDACVAQTEGSIGYFLELALRNVLRGSGESREVVTVLTTVEVAADDPHLEEPTKPVGPFYSKYRAEAIGRVLGWKLIDDSGRGFRRVVPSPKPLRVLNVDLIRTLMRSGAVVIAGGGGGVPVVREKGRWRGVEAVIDKDYTTTLLAEEVEADLLVILAPVDHVSLDYNTDRARPIREMTVSEAARYLWEGHFPKGSMGPKVEAAMEFASKRQGPVLITSIAALAATMDGQAGTRVVPDPTKP